MQQPTKNITTLVFDNTGIIDGTILGTIILMISYFLKLSAAQKHIMLRF